MQNEEIGNIKKVKILKTLKCGDEIYLRDEIIRQPFDKNIVAEIKRNSIRSKHKQTLQIIETISREPESGPVDWEDLTDETEPDFKTYVLNNVEFFINLKPRMKQKARKKWENLFGDEDCPFFPSKEGKGNGNGKISDKDLENI